MKQSAAASMYRPDRIGILGIPRRHATATAMFPYPTVHGVIADSGTTTTELRGRLGRAYQGCGEAQGRISSKHRAGNEASRDLKASCSCSTAVDYTSAAIPLLLSCAGQGHRTSTSAAPMRATATARPGCTHRRLGLLRRAPGGRATTAGIRAEGCSTLIADPARIPSERPMLLEGMGASLLRLAAPCPPVTLRDPSRP